MSDKSWQVGRHEKQIHVPMDTIIQTTVTYALLEVENELVL